MTELPPTLDHARPRSTALDRARPRTAGQMTADRIAADRITRCWSRICGGFSRVWRSKASSVVRKTLAGR
ncbi:hypothetical protein, partial [Kribbella sp. NPDC048915]|uniref:hypothetical protein n=1 Tax=Kribbella sp. NPDC048915 TaxID=3155148 RepID=UPI00340BEBB9